MLYAVEAGDRIAQLILERIITPDVVECDVRRLAPPSISWQPYSSFFKELEATARGAGGWGSTGGHVAL